MRLTVPHSPDHHAPPVPPRPPSDVLRALREATAARQSALDGRLPLAADEPGLAEASRHLQLLQAWLAPIEHWLAGFADGPQDPAWLAPRQRAALLTADLAHPLLQPWLAPTPDAAVALPWPAQASAAYRWGVVYVIEGTQLAGALLHRRVAEALAPLPLAYLSGDAAAPQGGVVARWQTVVRALNHAVRQRVDVQATCQGAGDALDRLLDLMGDAPRPPAWVAHDAAAANAGQHAGQPQAAAMP